MSYYKFSFTKGDISLEIESLDSSFVELQMNKWLEKVAGIKIFQETKTVIKQETSVPKAVETIPEPPVITAKKETAAVIVEKAPKESVKAEEKVALNLNTEAVVNNIQSSINEVKEVLPESFLSEIDTIVKKQETAKPDNEVEEAEFQQILQEKFSTLPEINEEIEARPTEEISEPEIKFATIEDLINLKKPESLLDYLLITAYYLKQKEMMDRYSVKQINGKILPFTKVPVNHSIIQDAVAKNYLEVVPDYTGVAEVTEYSITPEGENYLINVL